MHNQQSDNLRWGITVENVLNVMTAGAVDLFWPRVTPETLLSALGLIQMGEDTVSLLSRCPTCRCRWEFVLASVKQIARCRVTTPVIAASADRSVALFRWKSGVEKRFVSKSSLEGLTQIHTATENTRGHSQMTSHSTQLIPLSFFCKCLFYIRSQISSSTGIVCNIIYVYPLNK